MRRLMPPQGTSVVKWLRDRDATRPYIVLVAATLIAAAAASLSACRSTLDAPIEIDHRIDRARTPAATIRLLLQPEHRALSPRYLAAADETVETLSIWFPIDKSRTFTLVDPAWHRTPEQRPHEEGVTVLDRTPWWTTEKAMAPELAVARSLTRHVIGSTFDVRALPPWFVDGFAEYAARRIVGNRFMGLNNPPGFAMYEGRHFGGFVPWHVRIRLMPDSDGDPVPAFRRMPVVDAGDAGKDDALAALTGRALLVLTAAERWLGRPTYDAALTEVARQFRGRAPTLNDFSRVASEVSGENLDWLFTPGFDSSVAFDYGVVTLASEPAAGRFHTTVTIARRGNGIFSGTTAPRTGPFESGEGVAIAVTFANGQEVREHWDGRDERKTYEYDGSAAAVSVVVDPERRVTLDLQRTNNSRAIDPLTPVASRRWSARWQLWLQHLLLTWSSLV